MNISIAVQRGRVLAESLMTDACTITEAGTGDPIYDPVTDTYQYPAVTVVYDGKCRVRPARTEDRSRDAGADVVTTRSSVISIPMDVTAVSVDAVVLITASAQDPALADTRFRVVGVTKGSQVTARRLVCEEVTS